MPLDSTNVDQFLETLSPVSRHFGYLMEKLSGGLNVELRLAAALTSHSTYELGQVGLPLQAAGKSFSPEELSFALPNTDEWLQTLRSSPVVGVPGDFRPLIIDANGMVYLHRYWNYEKKLSEQIRARLTAAPYDPARLKDGLRRLVPDSGDRGTHFEVRANASTNHEVNWQKVAAAVAVTRNFSVICGGPGTGKTTTVLKVLALLAEQSSSRKPRFALAAPTGKAAARLQEAVQSGKANLACSDEVKALLPETASTLHRLLGSRPGSPEFKYNSDHLLPIDVLVIDEASMVDLALMVKTMAAVPPTARIILLGDKDQLSSIEVGVVLGELCAGVTNRFSKNFGETYHELTGEELPEQSEEGLLNDSIVELKQNFRFETASDIGKLSDSIKRGDADSVLDCLTKGSTSIVWRNIPSGAAFDEELRKVILENWAAYFAESDPKAAFGLFNRFRILTPLRHGTHGVEKLNNRVESILAKSNLIRAGSTWYHRRPLMVLQNDYNLKLFNGDIGILDDRGARDLQVFFPEHEGKSSSLSLARVPQHETVYAMTVHKSQGSEFEHVLLVLPEQASGIANRQLIYTALTRAKGKVTIWADGAVLRNAITSASQKTSNLATLLRGEVLT